LFTLFFGDDVDHPSHCVGTVEHGGGSSYHLHPLGHHRLITVGEWVSHEAHVLGVPVNQHQYACSGCTTDAAYAHASSRSVCYTITHHTSLGDKESRHLLGKQW